MIIINTTCQQISWGGKNASCRIGRQGFVAETDRREGDQKTPLGSYGFRFGLYRADRLARPESALVMRALHINDGWCDDPQDVAYNRFVRLPYGARHETLWRTDEVYDIILVISHNDSPPQAGLGSAVFVHLARPDGQGTSGCVAVDRTVMMDMLTYIRAGSPLQIEP